MDPDREWRPTSSTGLGWAGGKAEGNPTESLCRLLCTYPAVFSLKKKKLADWLRPEVTTWQLRASQRYHPKGGLSVSFVQCLHFEIEKFHISQGFPGGASDKEATCQCKRHKRCEFDPWFRKIPWRRAWQPTPVFLPGESRRQRSLVGYSPQGHKESDTTRQFSMHTYIFYKARFWVHFIKSEILISMYHKQPQVSWGCPFKWVPAPRQSLSSQDTPEASEVGPIISPCTQPIPAIITISLVTSQIFIFS